VVASQVVFPVDPLHFASSLFVPSSTCACSTDFTFRIVRRIPRTARITAIADMS
jgi:hypothetical protein